MIGIALRIDKMQTLLARFKLIVSGVIHLDAARHARILGMRFEKSHSGVEKTRLQLHIAIQQQQVIPFAEQPAQLMTHAAAAIFRVIEADHHRVFGDGQLTGIVGRQAIGDDNLMRIRLQLLADAVDRFFNTLRFVEGFNADGN